MKVYVVHLDNGQEYEDYEDWIDSVFKSYRSASQYLIDRGFVPYPFNVREEWGIIFKNPNIVRVNNQEGWINEFELQD